MRTGVGVDAQRIGLIDSTESAAINWYDMSLSYDLIVVEDRFAI